jgi:hypothetical protein
MMASYVENIFRIYFCSFIVSLSRYITRCVAKRYIIQQSMQNFKNRSDSRAEVEREVYRRLTQRSVNAVE